MAIIVLFAVAALLAGTPLRAQDRTAAIDSIFSFATSETPGCAVGVSQNGRVLVDRTYGLAVVERRVPLGRMSTFDIGSTQKQFVAAAILMLVEEGRLSLTEDIRKYLPELPDNGHRITLDHLMTHTSGIRDWTGMLPMAEEGTDVLELILRQRALNFAPGEEWSYSNSGYVLLKEIVARTSGMSFADFARARLFEPLNMKSSAYVADVLQGGESAALAYQKNGAAWTQFMRLGNERGGGAIISTAADLLAWNEALASGRLGALVTRMMHENSRLNNGRQLNYARGLIVEDLNGVPVVSHSGGAAGYSTFLGRFTEHALAVAVMCNFDPVSATALAGSVAEQFLPRAVVEQGRVRVPESAGSAGGVAINSRAGIYLHEVTGDPLRLSVNQGNLHIGNGPPLIAGAQDTFRPIRPSMFFRSQDAFVLRFLSADQFEFTSMEGNKERFRRAQPHAHSAVEMQSYEGRYRSEELGSTFEIIPGTNALVMRFASTPEKAIELTPVARDVWMRNLMIVRFRRDASGRVLGFDYGNPVVRGINFTREGDRRSGGQAH